ncbi:MAG TPA: hypothetical protein V6C52_06980 [Coleofasciculaceae cyanobacterium]|jgi:hypothetical protein
MIGKKTPAKKGLLPKLKGFLEGLGDRYQRVLQVIDEALASENFKDKIWAADWILKRTPPPEALSDTQKANRAAAKNSDLPELEQLSDAELLARLRQHLGDIEL